MARQGGFNVYLTTSSKTFVGVTSDELSVDTNTKESTTKDDSGVKNKRVTSHTFNFTVSGILDVTDDTSSRLNNDAIIALAYSKQSFTIIYNRGNGANYTGTAIVTGYSETTPADPDEDSTYSLQLRSHDLHKVTV
jgi:hypothetical protein